MCGIVGAVAQRDIAEILLEGLRRLEYRGYDSAGMAVVDHEGHLQRLREVGKVQMLAEEAEKNPVSGGTGIAHTRWATHGIPSERNAHPHTSGYIAVVHNGIIENYLELKEELKKLGYVFSSETDTEVIAHLVHHEQQKGGSLVEVVQRVIPQLRGAYGTVIMDSRIPELLVAARSGSPLVIGLGVGENFLASDQLALLPVTRRFITLKKVMSRKLLAVLFVFLIITVPLLNVSKSNQMFNMMQVIKAFIVITCKKKFTNSQWQLKTPLKGVLTKTMASI